MDGQIFDFFFFFLSGLQKFRIWSLWLVSFLVGLRTYQHPSKHVNLREQQNKSVLLFISHWNYSRIQRRVEMIDKISRNWAKFPHSVTMCGHFLIYYTRILTHSSRLYLSNKSQHLPCFLNHNLHVLKKINQTLFFIISVRSLLSQFLISLWYIHGMLWRTTGFMFVLSERSTNIL